MRLDGLMEHGLQSQWSGLFISVLLQTSCVALAKAFDFPEPHFLHLENENKNTCLAGLGCPLFVALLSIVLPRCCVFFTTSPAKRFPLIVLLYSLYLWWSGTECAITPRYGCITYIKPEYIWPRAGFGQLPELGLSW